MKSRRKRNCDSKLAKLTPAQQKAMKNMDLEQLRNLWVQEAYEQELECGVRARVVNLFGAPDYNGREGVIVEYNGERDGWIIELDRDFHYEKERVGIKSHGNLTTVGVRQIAAPSPAVGVRIKVKQQAFPNTMSELAQYNGREGLIIGKDMKKGGYVIKLDPADGTSQLTNTGKPEYVGIKDENKITARFVKQVPIAPIEAG